jgi:DNA polymerase-3 subunit gamma/tau
VVETRGATAVSVAPASAPRPNLENVPQTPPTVPSIVPPPVIPPTHSIAAAADEEPQQAVVDALAAARLSSAADAIADAVWTIANGEATVQTQLSAKMLPVVINAEADKIVRATLRKAGILNVTLLPGATEPTGAAKKPRTPRTGSVQAKALEHPMVQQAQKLFQAEIQTVIDLRDND